jgi:hypothetical protein
LSVADGKAWSFALELDRSTEDQQAWRRKVAALALWAAGPYRETFDTDNVIIAVVCRDDLRRGVMAGWTMRELESRGLESFANNFLFTAASPADRDPAEFFFTPLWYLPHEPRPVSLLDPPAAAERRVSLHVA